MKTSHKVVLAKIAYRVAHRVRRFVGMSDQCIVMRNGNRLELDLSEGIDFAVYLRRYEPSTTSALARLVKPNTNVLDIGANVGVHAVHMARLVGPNGRVFAFEPTTFAFRKLERNLEINPELHGRVLAVQCFLAPSGIAHAPTNVYSSWPLKGGTDLHEKHRGQPMATDNVASRSVDEFLAERGNPPIALVKLDVDGYECEVLAGATLMLQRDRPIFVMELAPYVLEEHGRSLRDLLAYFTPHGYRFYHERDTQDRPLSIDKIFHAIRDGASINVVARTR